MPPLPVEPPDPAKPPFPVISEDPKLKPLPAFKLEGPELILDPAKWPKKFSEAPMLAELVKQGKLPPVEQRVPQEPLVIKPVLGLRPQQQEDGRHRDDVLAVEQDVVQQHVAVQRLLGRRLGVQVVDLLHRVAHAEGEVGQGRHRR